MTKHIPAGVFARAKPAALIGHVRADASPAELLASLNTAFESFKAENDARIKALETGKSVDVLATEKLDRVNADITALNKALDDINAAVAAGKLGGGAGDPLSADQREHAKAFEKFFRKGVDANLSDLEVKAKLTSQSDPDGGYLVPTQIENTIDRVLGTVSIMRELATVMPVTTAEYKKIVNVGGAGAGWVGEEETRPETNTPLLKQLLFTVMEMYANPMTTQGMLDDGIVDIAAWLADEVNITFAEQEGAATMTGNGVKRPRGLFSYDAVANASYEWGKVGFIVSGHASAFASSAPGDALVDLYHALKQGYRNNGTFLMSDATLAKVRKMKDGQGNYLWAPPTVAEAPSTILGKQVRTDDNCPAVEANAFPIAFGDFKRAYLMVDRQGIRVLRDPYTNKPYVGFYTTKRVGGGIANFEAVKLLKIST